jgi:hypothetical protein
MISKSKLGAVALLLLGSLCVPHHGGQAATSPLTAMAGLWSGGGTLTTSAGAQERLRCRATYRVADGGDNLQLNLRCASESYTFDLSSAVQHRGGTISGTWNEATYSASGTISGRASGEQIQVAARGENFSASLSLTTRGNRQAVAIQSQGAAVMAISITLSRR